MDQPAQRKTDSPNAPAPQDAGPPPSPPESPKRRGGWASVWMVVRILNVRLRFIAVMVVIGVIAGNWETIMNHYDRWRRPAQAADMVKAEAVEYYCGMHPSVVKSEPGNCPICGMPLIKRAKTAQAPLPAGVLGRVQLTPLKMIMGRIGAAPVEYRLLAREIRSVGIVDYDETRRATITARFKGRLDKLMVNYTGQVVRKGEPLALIYSPDLLVAQEELLAGVKAAQEQSSATGINRELTQNLVDAAKKKMLLWGLTEEQVADVIRRGAVQTHMTIASPMAGIVTEKKMLEGKYANEGDEIYTIADLSTVWLQAKIYESEIAGVEIGTAVAVTSTAYPTEVFAGRIAFVAYALDTASRTLAARVEIANPELKLRPGMYVMATIRLPAGKVTELAGVAASAPATASAPSTGPPTDALAQAYLRVAEALSADRSDEAAAPDLAAEAEKLAARLPAARELAAKAHELHGKPLPAQREAFKAVSEATIRVLQLAPPARELYVIYCPDADARWLSPRQEVQNPYRPDMRDCGKVVGPLKPSAVREDAHSAGGYYCPLYPDRLFGSPEECPLDKFPLKYARVEKVLAVPESSVIDTGTRQIVYRQGAPGVFDMVQVRLGPRAGEFYPVLEGLKEGDQVATQGAFLVDAENRLNPAAGAQYFGASGSAQSGGGAGAAPPGHAH